MATKIGRSLDEIKNKSKELNAEVRSLTSQNKLLDRSLKFDTNPFETLTKRAENTKQSITAVTQRIELLKEQQKEYEQLLATGAIKQSTYDKLATDITRTEFQLKQLNAELKETNKTIALLPAQKFKELGTAIEGAGNKLKGLSVTAGAVLGSLTAIGLSAISTADDLATVSANLGITAEELQYLNYIATQTDVSVEKMQKAFVKTRDALGSKLLGETTSAVKALDQLGISAENFGSDLDAFYSVADALGKIENSTLQATIANDIFGEKIGTEMISFLTTGKDALVDYENELSNIGLLSNEAVSELANFDNSMNEIKQSFAQTKNELGLALLPVMEQIADFLENKFIPFINNLVEKFSKLSDETKGIIVGVLGFLTVLAPLLIIIGKITSGIGGIIGLIPKLSGLLTTLSAHPIIAIIGIIAVLLTTLYAKNEKFRESINKLFGVLSKSLEPILSLVSNLLSDIFEILTPVLDLLGNVLASRINLALKLMKPLLDAVAWLVEKISWLINKGMSILGKGWLWGKENNGIKTNEVNVPTFNSYSYSDSNSTKNSNLNINLNATGDTPMSDENAKHVASFVLDEIDELLGARV